MAQIRHDLRRCASDAATRKNSLLNGARLEQNITHQF
jgi:hypothetical protein